MVVSLIQCFGIVKWLECCSCAIDVKKQQPTTADRKLNSNFITNSLSVNTLFTGYKQNGSNPEQDNDNAGLGACKMVLISRV
jgi:hypothetical protein